MADPIIQTLSIFAGGGYHDTAVSLVLEALGFDVRSVGYAERDSAAAAMLLARMEQQTIHPAPVWCDCISRLDARPLRGCVDMLIASPPCQPYSAAGSQRGHDDHRSYGADDAPLPHLVRIIGECRPALVWLENVPEWWTDGVFRRCGDELSGLGYKVQDVFFADARSAGGVHGRERGFCLCVADSGGHDQWREQVEKWRQNPRASTSGSGGGVAVSACRGSGAVRKQSGCSGQPDGLDQLADAGSIGRRAQSNADGAPGRDDRRVGFVRPIVPPGRPIFDDELAAYCARDRATLASVRERIASTAGALRQFAALAVSGLDAADMPAIEPKFPVVDDGLGIANGDLLRIGGNGVDVLASAHAFAHCLLRGIGGGT